MREYFKLIPEQKLGILRCSLEQEVMDKLWEYIETAKKNNKLIFKDSLSWNAKLAGHISSSLALEDKDDWFFNRVVSESAAKYNEIFPIWDEDHSVLTENKPYMLESMWVNFQKKHEFNPVHKHSGVYSFVIWMQIPYTHEEQTEVPIVKHSNTAVAGCFHFYYTDMMGRVGVESLVSDSSTEGTMLMFPSELKHGVTPFYGTDKERITISGNLRYDVGQMEIIKKNEG